MSTRRGLILDANDNVANVLESAAAGDAIAAVLGSETTVVPALEDIPFGFKVALVDVPAGGPVVKYGEVIGRASRPIQRGELVHIHNLEGNRGRGDTYRRDS